MSSPEAFEQEPSDGRVARIFGNLSMQINANSIKTVKIIFTREMRDICGVLP